MLEKIKQFFRDLFTERTRLWKTITIISIVLFLSAFWLAIISFQKTFKPKTAETETQTETEIKEAAAVSSKCAGCERRNLDGVWVAANKTNLPPVAVAIDNHPSARPAAGLEKASLVYEAEVEGNYTRYLAVFATDEEVEEIGPVRSARPYFVEWAKELNATFAHCGGSPEALVKIAQKDVVDLNEFYNGQYFWRSVNRTAPHNIMTSSDNLGKFFENKKIASGNFSLWQFKEDKESSGRVVKNPEIKIDFNHQNFKVRWDYSEEDNDYTRFLEDAPQVTAANNILAAKNIIIQRVPAEVIDDKLRLKMEVIGSGEAVICLDGECRAGEWRKENSASRTRYYYPDRDEAYFNAGPTWVEIIRPEVAVTY